MIVFTNTRTEESSSLSLNSTQIFIQSYYNNPISNQFYKSGPRGVAVSIGACGELLEKVRALIESSQIALGLGSNPDEGPIFTEVQK